MENSKKSQPSWRERLYPELLPNDEFIIWLGRPYVIFVVVAVAVYFAQSANVTPREAAVSSVVFLGCANFLAARAVERRHAQFQAKIEQLEAELKATQMPVPGQAPSQG